MVDMKDSKGRQLMCRKCGSTDLRFYDGCLGYEAVVCNRCGTHHTDDSPLVVARKKRGRRSGYHVRKHRRTSTRGNKFTAGRVKSTTCPDCGSEVWDIAKGHKLNKCWGCGLRFD